MINVVDENAVTNRAELWTIQRILVWSTQYLKEKCPDTNATNFRLEAELLLSQSLGLPRIQLYMHLEKPLSTGERNAFKELLRRRVSGEPVAYIMERKEFFGKEFKVNQHTLIPRPDTEILVETALEHLKKLQNERKNILDIGSGSGCIGISIALNAAVDVESWDISEEALMVSRENAQKLNCDSIQFLNRDGLSEESWSGESRFDLIVSNPPYLSQDEMHELSPSVLRFEPNQALFAGQSGLEFYETIANRGKKLLKANGICMVEIGHKQKTDVEAVFLRAGWTLLQVCRDLAGIERVMVFQ